MSDISVYKRIRVELRPNERTKAGLESEHCDFEVDGYGEIMTTDGDIIMYNVYISRGDLGRWDAEGLDYITDLLGCQEGDIGLIETDWLTPEEEEAGSL